jgi:hypothetical protein
VFKGLMDCGNQFRQLGRGHPVVADILADDLSGQVRIRFVRLEFITRFRYNSCILCGENLIRYKSPAR